MLNSPFVPLVLPTWAEISRNGVFKIAPFYPACLLDHKQSIAPVVR